MALGRFIDIQVSNPDNIIWPVYVQIGYTDEEVAVVGIDEATLGFYYWGSWHRCSDTGVDTEANIIWANVNEEETNLAGTPFAAGGGPVDVTPPSVAMVSPPAECALQDGVTFIASAHDDESGVCSLTFSIREANGSDGEPVGFEDLPAAYDAATDQWTLHFDTLQLPDGYYIVVVKATDNAENVGSITVPYSIRNWAVLELLPACDNNKAGRTMPVKFSLRVAASVDPSQPFVYNEELTIKVFATNNPSKILQASTFGDEAKDYRIDTGGELYITNFKTLKTPTQYTVEVYRDTFLIGRFTTKTVK